MPEHKEEEPFHVKTGKLRNVFHARFAPSVSWVDGSSLSPTFVNLKELSLLFLRFSSIWKASCRYGYWLFSWKL